MAYKGVASITQHNRVYIGRGHDTTIGKSYNAPDAAAADVNHVYANNWLYQSGVSKSIATAVVLADVVGAIYLQACKNIC